MECSNPTCSCTGNDRMVACWLCVGHFHLKCCGLKARDADALADPQKFLQWTCPSCRKISVEFYKLFKNSKDEFDAIKKEFLSLQNKLDKYGDLFNNYANLEKFENLQHNVSPKRKKGNLRSASSQGECATTSSVTNSASMAANFHGTEFPQSLEPGLPLPSPLVNNVIQSVPVNELTPNSALAVYNYPQTAPNNSQAVSNSAPVPVLNNIQYVPKPLRAVPQHRSVFVSRLASETTIEDIEYYIKSKCGENAFVSAYKFVYQQSRSISSFKITVPEEAFNNIIDYTFWPTGTFVREYVYNSNRRSGARLPARTPSSPKN